MPRVRIGNEQVVERRIMRKQLGRVTVDIYPPEREKYRAPLLMIHDLWVAGWTYHDWATRLCNLGWHCWTMNLPGREQGDSDQELSGIGFPDCVDDVKLVIKEMPSPPVVLGHGLGAGLALRAMHEVECSAGIVLAPYASLISKKAPPRALRLLRLKYGLLLLLHQPIRVHPKDFRQYWLNQLEETRQREILEGLVPESPHLVRCLFSSLSITARPTGCPILIIGGAQDRLVSSADLASWAKAIKAPFWESPHLGHWMLHAANWETLVNRLHRWLVHTLGEAILLPGTGETKGQGVLGNS